VAAENQNANTKQWQINGGSLYLAHLEEAVWQCGLLARGWRRWRSGTSGWPMPARPQCLEAYRRRLAVWLAVAAAGYAARLAIWRLSPQWRRNRRGYFLAICRSSPVRRKYRNDRLGVAALETASTAWLVALCG